MDRQIGAVAGRIVRRRHPGYLPLRSFVHAPEPAGAAVNRFRPSQLRTRRTELQRLFPAPLVQLPPPGVRSVLPGHLEGDPPPDAQPRTALRNALAAAR